MFLLVIISIRKTTIDRIIPRITRRSIDQTEGSENPKKLENNPPKITLRNVKINPPIYPSMDFWLPLGNSCLKFLFVAIIPKIDAIPSPIEVINAIMINKGNTNKRKGANPKTIIDVLANVSNSSGVKPLINNSPIRGGI